MRRKRVAGNETPKLPVMFYVTPRVSMGSMFAAQPRRRDGSARAAVNGLLSRARHAPSDANLNMNDEVRGNQKHARFQALCQSLRPDLLRFALWLSRDRSLAEDVVQETMLRAWKARDALKDEAAAKPWLLTIIRREYARTFERKRLPTVDIDSLIAGEEPALATADDQAQMELREALFALPEDYREPLVLQVLMGLSTAEIAAHMGLSNAAVLTRLFRARKQLRAVCGEDTSLDPDE
jgi:RNA polymerase sigma-70 factor (ECF subfamily)